MDTNNVPSNCGVCKEDFDEKARCPRIFPCSHTLCHHCIDKLISKKKKICPFCREPFKAITAKDITVNHSTLEFMRYLGSQNSTPNPTQRELPTSRQESIQEMKKEALVENCRHLFDCQAAKTEIQNFSEVLNKLQGTIIDENKVIESDILPKFQFILFQNWKMLEELYKTSQDFTHHMTDICSKNNQLEDLKSKLEACTAGTFGEISGILDEADEIHVPIGLWLRSFKETISEAEEAVITKQKDVQDTKESLSVIQETLKLLETKRRVTYPMQQSMENQCMNNFVPPSIKLPPQVLAKSDEHARIHFTTTEANSSISENGKSVPLTDQLKTEDDSSSRDLPSAVDTAGRKSNVTTRTSNSKNDDTRALPGVNVRNNGQALSQTNEKKQPITNVKVPPLVQGLGVVKGTKPQVRDQWNNIDESGLSDIIRGGPSSKIDFYIWRVDKSIDDNAFKSFITSTGITVIEFYKVSKINSNFKSYRIVVYDHDKDKVMSGELWPPGVCVQKWVQKK